MPAKRIPWFKIWIGATAHGKVRQLEDGVFRTWVELLDAAAQQPVRGRFASRAEAAAVLRRPVKHLAVLIGAGLIDEDPDKHLVMHDWDDWQRWRQEDSNDAPHTPEGPTNNTRTTTERQLNDSVSTVDSLTIDNESTQDELLNAPRGRLSARRRRREKEEEDVEERKREKTDGEIADPADQPPKLLPVPKSSRSAEVIDAIRAVGIEPTLTARDHAALKTSNASAELIAELYGEVFNGRYGDAYQQRNLSVHELLTWIDGYRSFKANGLPKPVLVGRNGYAERPRRIVDHTGCPPGCPSSHPEQAS